MMMMMMSNHGVVMVVRACDWRLRCGGFNSWPCHFHITSLEKLFTHAGLCHSAVKFNNFKVNDALWLGR